MTSNRVALFAILAALLSLTGVANAQFPAGGGGSLDNSAPANSIQGNFTAGVAAPTNNVIVSCTDAGGNHLNFVPGTGVTCGTSGSATVSVTAACPGIVISPSPGNGTF